MLSALPVNPRKGRKGELRDIVEALRPELEEAHDVKKYTWEELCEYLKGAGIEISVHTLKTYMRKPKGETHEASPVPLPQKPTSQNEGDDSDDDAATPFTHLPPAKRTAKDHFKVR